MRSLRGLITCVLAAVIYIGVVGMSNPVAAQTDGAFVGTAQDIEVDPTRGVAYISVPDAGRVYVIDTTTGQTESFRNFDRPTGLALSDDNNTLYVALNDGLRVAEWHLSTDQVGEFAVPELGDDSTWDVALAGPNTLVMSASPRSSGFAWIVARDLVNGTNQIVASNRIIRSDPVIVAGPEAVFVGEGFSPQSLYKLDATSPELPLVLEDDHGDIGGTSRLAISPDGSVVATAAGQLIDAQTLTVIGSVNPGTPAFGADGTLAILGPEVEDSNQEATLFAYAPGTYVPVGQSQACGSDTSFQHSAVSRVLPEGDVISVVGGRVCIGSLATPTEPDPGPLGSGPIFDLQAVPYEAVFDEARGVSYVSVPEQDRVVVIDNATGDALSSQFFSHPNGIVLAEDGSELYVALNGSTSIAIWDLETSEVRNLVVEATGHPTTWDVGLGRPGELLVSASPRSSGFASLAAIDLETGDSRPITAMRASPVIHSRGGQIVVGEGFSPPTSYRLDRNHPDYQVLTEDSHNGMYGLLSADLSADGETIVNYSGQVVHVPTLQVRDTIDTYGLPAFGPDQEFWVLEPAGGLAKFDATTASRVDAWSDGCGVPDRDALLTLFEYLGPDRFLVGFETTVCVVSPSELPPPGGEHCTIWGTDGRDVLEGTDGDDVICGFGGNDVIQAGDGNDIVYGGRGKDEIHGGAGNDELHGDQHNDRIFGGPGDDTLIGYSGQDKLVGQGGDDTLTGGGGDDQLRGGSGDDEINGGRSNDRADGGPGADLIFGKHGADRLSGGSGRDRLVGGAGDDFLTGGRGRDELKGGKGFDTCATPDQQRGCEA